MELILREIMRLVLNSIMNVEVNDKDFEGLNAQFKVNIVHFILGVWS